MHNIDDFGIPSHNYVVFNVWYVDKNQHLRQEANRLGYIMSQGYPMQSNCLKKSRKKELTKNNVSKP